MEHKLSVDDLLERWQTLCEQGKKPTADDLCASSPKLTAELREQLQAVASMMSLLGLDEESNPVGSIATADSLQVRSAATVETDRSGGAADRGSHDTKPVLQSTLEGQHGELAVESDGVLKSVQVPGYEVLEELGRGGMGVVYKARQQSLDRMVALKMILAASHAGSASTARFLHEAKTIASLKHTHVVQVYEFGSHEGRPFFSLEYLEGGSLAEKLRGEPQAPAQAAKMVQTLAQAVQAAHEQGIVHRDLKPANVLLTANGIAKISDFGIAKQSDSIMTATGEVLGTPSYMAPEQAAGKTKGVGAPADIYALGAILYELLTGRPPFKGASSMGNDSARHTFRSGRARQMQPRVPRDLETICLKCLEKEPARRYPTATDVARDLGRFLAGEPIHARPVGKLERAGRWCLRNKAVAASLAAVALSLLAATVVSLIFALRTDRALRAEAERGQGETKAKQEAVQARRDVQQQLIDLSTESGLAAARDGDHALALLWFARAAQLSRDDPGREALSRIRYANWLRQVWMPEGIFGISGFRHDQDRFRQVSFSSDENYVLASAGAGDRVIWDRVRGRLVPLAGPAARGLAAAWDPKSRLLAVGGQDGKVTLLAPPGFNPVQEIPAEGAVAVVTFSRDGRFIAWGGDTGARIWDREKKAFSSPFLPHGGAVATLAFSADAAMLVTSARDMKARVFDVVSDKSEPLFPPVDHFPADYGINHGGPERVAPRFAAGDQKLLTVVRIGGRYHLQWRSAATGQILGTSEAPPGHDYLSAFDVSPDAERVFVSCNDGIIRMCDARTRAIVASARTNEYDWCEDLIFSADGRVGVSVGADMTARSWLVQEGRDLTLEPASTPVAHPHQAVRVALSPDGRHMAVALWDGRVCLWRHPQGPPVAYEIAAGGPSWVALSPDRRLILLRGTSFRSGTLRETQVFDASTGLAESAKLAPGGIVVDAAFSPDGTQVAIAALTAQTTTERAQRIFLDDGRAGNVQVWDWKNGAGL